MKKIISVDELKDFAAVEVKLSEYGEGYIFQNNKPTHVVMTLEKYERLADGTSETEPVDTSNEGLDSRLNKIGKKIFVDYYDIFKSDNNPEMELEAEGFTLPSKRIDVETVNKATVLLARENGCASSMDMSSDDEQYCVKIGKMMRGILTKLLQNHVFTDDELAQMQTEQYSKAVFNLNFPVLKILTSGQPLDEAKRDAKGYNRYYDAAVIVNGKEYLICSQWVENLHKEKAETWIVDKMADIVSMVAAEIPEGSEFSVHEVLSDYWPHIDWLVRKRIGSKYKQLIKDRTGAEPVAVEEHGKNYRKMQ